MESITSVTFLLFQIFLQITPLNFLGKDFSSTLSDRDIEALAEADEQELVQDVQVKSAALSIKNPD